MRTLLLLTLVAASTAGAQSPYQWELGAEYLGPIDDARRIETVQFDLRARRQFGGPLRLSIAGGLTLSRAWGGITQLDSTLSEVDYSNEAIGLGPVATARTLPIRVGPVALGAEVSAGLLYYTSPFPAGGDHYNGMFRLGPTVAWTIRGGSSLTVAGHWMHVSNGTGVRPENPSYEARGLELSYQRPLLASTGGGRPPGVATGGIIGGALGGVVGALASRHCDDDGCGPGPGITLGGALSGGALAAVVGGLIAGR